MRHIESLLRKLIGLDAVAIGPAVIERTIRTRMRLHGLRQPNDYRQLLLESPTELNELIEAVVVTETWFFRDRGPFTAFAQLAKNEWLPQANEVPLRILSVPCSSGEEPYSLVMALLDTGFPSNRFQIDAVDISAAALERAHRAEYGRNSFRGDDLTYRDRHFVELNGLFQLNSDVREKVTYIQANVLDEDFFCATDPYDFIFCRNLLIYFDRATQLQALGKLRNLMKPDGYLFLGPAELPLADGQGFTNARLSQAFACRRATVPFGPPPPERRTQGVQIPALAGSGVFQDQNPVLPPIRPERRNGHSEVIELAYRCADGGDLTRAEELCLAHLADHSDSAEAYYLLGLVKDATNNPEAIEYYRKALYLDPNHYEALIHAATWLERAGSSRQAAQLKQRAIRLRPNPSPDE